MIKEKRERERKEKSKREGILGYEDAEWKKIISDGLIRKRRVLSLTCILNATVWQLKSNWKKKKLDLVSAHIQLSAALGSVSTIKDTVDYKSNATSSETHESLDTSLESNDCFLQEVPLAHLTSKSCRDSDSDVLWIKLGYKAKRVA